ncbi:MAG: hypothetical protein Q9187_003314 [Circinaria calcarea]
MTTSSLRQITTVVRLHRDAIITNAFRAFSSYNALCSGHNRWSKIKHDKGKVDAARNKQRSSLAKELATISKQYGGDPSTNPRLAGLIVTAKKAGFPKASIESAIARGQGLSTSGVTLENLTIEAMLPPSIAIIIECQTDSKARTMHDLRDILKYFGASMTQTAYMFERKGRISFVKLETIGDEQILEQAIEAGALDVEIDEDGKTVVVFTDPSQITTVAQAITTALKLDIENSDVIWDAKEDTKVKIQSSEMEEKVSNLVCRLEDDPSVQEVYLNAS